MSAAPDQNFLAEGVGGQAGAGKAGPLDRVLGAHPRGPMSRDRSAGVKLRQTKGEAAAVPSLGSQLEIERLPSGL